MSETVLMVVLLSPTLVFVFLAFRLVRLLPTRERKFSYSIADIWGFALGLTPGLGLIGYAVSHWNEISTTLAAVAMGALFMQCCGAVAARAAYILKMSPAGQTTLGSAFVVFLGTLLGLGMPLFGMLFLMHPLAGIAGAAFAANTYYAIVTPPKRRF